MKLFMKLSWTIDPEAVKNRRELWHLKVQEFHKNENFPPHLRRNEMEQFKDEFEDLKNTYEGRIDKLGEILNIAMRNLVDNMESFCKIYRQIDCAEEKLELLEQKLQTQQEKDGRTS